MAEINEIISKEAVQTILNTDKAVTNLDESLRKLLQDIEGGQKVVKANAITFDELEKAQKKVATTTKEIDKVGKQLAATEEKLKQLEDARTKTIIANRDAISKKTAAIKAETQANKVLKGSYDQIDLALKKNTADYKKLSEAQRANTAVGGKLLSNIKKQDAALKKLDTQMGKSNRHVGNYGRAVTTSAKSMIGALGLTSGVFLLAKVLKDSFATLTQYEAKMSEVAAITNATAEEMEDLTKLTKDLGGTTKFTSIEVAALAVELGRLGFTTAEILASTEAILDLAAATNTDLARAAEVSGSVIRAFGFSAEQTKRVVDVMAESFSATALNLERFATAMSTVAPVAKNANVSFERTTALLGVLVNRGIDASTAGTALRNVFLELSKQGLTYEDAMLQINTAVDKNAIAFELFGKRGATVATVLAATEVESGKLTQRLLENEDAASKMAATMQDNLQGDLTRLTSAWSKLVLNMDGSTSVFRRVIQFFQNIILSVANFGLTLKRVSKLSEEESKKMFDFITNRAGKTADALREVLDEYSDLTANSLAQQKQAFLEEVRDTGLSKKKSLVIYDNFLKQRITQINAEFTAQKEAAKIEANRLENEIIVNEAKKAIADAEAAEVARKLAIKNSKEAIKIAERKAKDELRIAERKAKEEQNIFIRSQKELNSLAEEELQNTIDGLELEFEAWLEGEEQKEELAKLFKEHQEQLDQEYRDNKADKDKAAREQNAQDAVELASIVGSASIAIYQNRIEAEYQLNEADKANQLKLAGDDEAQKEAIEEKFAKKQGELRLKQAKADRLAALFNIAIDTAQAVMKLTAQTGVLAPLAIPLAIAAGVASAAVVLSQPLPKYKDGTKGQFNTPSSFIAGEAGTEIVERGGRTQTVSQATLFTNSAGSRVYSNPELQQMMDSGTIGFDDSATKAMHQDLSKAMHEMTKAVKNKREYIIDQSGKPIGFKQNGKTTRYIERMLGN